jgi:hypothetical protein
VAFPRTAIPHHGTDNTIYSILLPLLEQQLCKVLKKASILQIVVVLSGSRSQPNGWVVVGRKQIGLRKALLLDDGIAFSKRAYEK